MEPLSYDEVRTRPTLEQHLESIISSAAMMADSSCTRDDTRDRIVQECQAVRQALQDLLTEYINNVSTFMPDKNIFNAAYNFIQAVMWSLDYFSWSCT